MPLPSTTEIIATIRATPSRTYGEVDQEIAVYERRLLSPKVGNRKRFDAVGMWAEWFDPMPGVYAVFEKGELVYVGESGNLKGRMRDMLSSPNHTVRHSIGNSAFAGVRGFVPINCRERYPMDVEARLNEYMSKHVAVAATRVHFGRLEVEEHLIAKYRPRYCTKGRRSC